MRWGQGGSRSQRPRRSLAPTTKGRRARCAKRTKRTSCAARSWSRPRRLVDQRMRGGRRFGNRRARPTHLTANSLVRAFRQEADRQRLLVKKAELTRNRLVFIVSALQMLLADEHFVTLLRAEGLDSLPRYLAERIDAGGTPAHQPGRDRLRAPGPGVADQGATSGQEARRQPQDQREVPPDRIVDRRGRPGRAAGRLRGPASAGHLSTARRPPPRRDPQGRGETRCSARSRPTTKPSPTKSGSAGSPRSRSTSLSCGRWKRGVSEQRIARALNVDVPRIRQKRRLLDGICSEAVELSRTSICERGDRAVQENAACPAIEAAELMLAANNFSEAYARALLAATPQDQARQRSSQAHQRRQLRADGPYGARDGQPPTRPQAGRGLLRRRRPQPGCRPRLPRQAAQEPNVARYLERHQADIARELQDLIETIGQEHTGAA